MKKRIKFLILLLLIFSSFFLELFGLSEEMGGNYYYIFKPLLWCFICIITIVFFRSDVIPNKKYKREIEFYAVVTTLLYFLIYFMFGYTNGFANNPYDYSLNGILVNLWTFIPMLIARECARYYLVNNCPKKHMLWYALLISLIFALIQLDITNFSKYFSNSASIAKFIMETFIPLMMVNMYLTYICYYAGYGVTIFYSFLPQLAMFSFKILPNVSWILLAILDSAIPFFSYVFINYRINKMDKTLDRRVYKTVGIKGWLSMIAIVFIMIVFGLGYLPYKPLVIASDSMYPKIKKGDMVLIKDIDVMNIKKGDIIRYQVDNYYVVHRVIEIKKTDSGKRQFVMMGDNNNDKDLMPVEERQIRGIIKFNIPYVGWPTLLLNQLMNPSAKDSVKVETGK